MFNELVDGGVLNNSGVIKKIPSAPDLPVDPVFYPYRDKLSKYLDIKGKGTKIGQADLSTELKLPESPDVSILREAHRTLNGSIIHTELYGKRWNAMAEIPRIRFQNLNSL